MGRHRRWCDIAEEHWQRSLGAEEGCRARDGTGREVQKSGVGAGRQKGGGARMRSASDCGRCRREAAMSGKTLSSGSTSVTSRPHIVQPPSARKVHTRVAGCSSYSASSPAVRGS